MKIRVLAYKDTKLNVFTNPFYVADASNEDVIENTRRMCANPSMPVSYFEYDLYSLGSYDDKLGKFDVSEPEFLVSLGDYKHLAAEKVDKVDVVG